MAKRTTIDDVANECLASRARMVSRVVTSIFDSHMRPLGLKTSQANILIVVAKLKTAEHQRISEVLQIEQSTVSRNVNRMIASGWLEEIEHGEDARHRPVRVSTKGRRLIAKLLPAWADAQAEAKEAMGQKGAQSLLDLASQLKNSAER